jgi:hypothetical protein
MRKRCPLRWVMQSGWNLSGLAYPGLRLACPVGVAINRVGPFRMASPILFFHSHTWPESPASAIGFSNLQVKLAGKLGRYGKTVRV